MTQEDVDLIYNYLHKYYKYEHGNLIRVISSNGHEIGEKLGTFSFNKKWKTPSIKCVLVINKKRFPSMLSHFIWIFHHRKKPKYIDFVDGNVANTDINNLKELSIREQYLKNTENCKGIFKIINETSIKWRTTIHVGKKLIFLGHHDIKKEAENIYKLAREAVSLEILDKNGIKKYINTKLGFDKIPINKNKNGYKGIKKTKYDTYYGYSIKRGRKILTPCFKTPEEAHKAYLKAMDEYETTKTISTTSS